MPFTLAQIIASARDRTGNKIERAIGEHQIPSTAIEAEMREQIQDCLRAFGQSGDTAGLVEAGFTAFQPTPISTPPAPTLTPTTTGGTLAAGTYSYRVSAYRSLNGETLAGPNTESVVTGSTGSVLVAWAAVANAVGYRVYGRALGRWRALASVTGLSWTDTGAARLGGGVPAVDSTNAGGYEQDYDVADLIGSDVLEIEDVIRSDAYVSDYSGGRGTTRMGVLTGTGDATMPYIEQGMQGEVMDVLRQQARWRSADRFDWSVVMTGGRQMLRLTPAPCEGVWVSVRYFSTLPAFSTLPDIARIPLEHAACAAILSCILSRTDSIPPEALAGTGGSVLDRRAQLDSITKQRDYYLARFADSLSKFQ